MKKITLSLGSRTSSVSGGGKTSTSYRYRIIAVAFISCFLVYHFLVVQHFHHSDISIQDGALNGGSLGENPREKLRGWPSALQNSKISGNSGSLSDNSIVLNLSKHKDIRLDGANKDKVNEESGRNYRKSIYVPPKTSKADLLDSISASTNTNTNTNSNSNSNSNSKSESSIESRKESNSEINNSESSSNEIKNSESKSNKNSENKNSDNNNIESNRNTLLESKSDTLINHSPQISSSLMKFDRKEGDVRIAVIIPYFGPALPPWFDMFVFQSRLSRDVVDWLIFINDADYREVPDNIKLIKMKKENLCERLARLDEDVADLVDEPKEQFCNLITKQPYVLVEFKPALGFLFNDYLKNYTHWALGDIDVMPGRLGHLIDTPTLKAFDIVTLSFGDNFRMYMRGQLTIHKNNLKVNSIWKKCTHLSKIGSRLRSFSESSNGHWHFESAEGCYSKVVSQSKVKVFVSNTQITDAFGAPLDEKESFYLGPALMRCYEKPLSFKEFDKYIKPIYFPDDTGASSKTELDVLKGDYPTRMAEYKCSYWVSDLYQACLDKVPANADIISNNQVVSYRIEPKYLLANGRCREGGVAHFQGWKERFHPYTSRSPSLDSHAILITDVGLIPLVVPELQGYSYGEQTGMRTRLGFFSPSDTDDKKTDMVPYHVDRFKSISTSYCIGFSRDLKKCYCQLSGDDVEISQISDQIRAQNVPQITLITVAWAEDFYDKKLDKLLDSWSGLKLVILARSNRLDKRSEVPHRQDVTVVDAFIGNCGYIDKIDKNVVLPDSALYNIGMDLATTDAIALSPPSITFRTFQDLKNGLIVDNNYVSTQYVAEKVLLQLDQVEFTSDENIVISFGHFISFNNLDDDEKIMYKKENKDFVEYSKKPAKGTDKIVQKSDNIRNLIPFPLPQISSTNEKSCGVQQSSRLLLSYEERLEHFNSPFPSAIDFNAQDFLKARTIMSPIAFRRSESPHGRDFARFPEEYNGPGCYGSSILRVLAGSGYSIYWSNELFAEEIMFDGVSARGDISGRDSKYTVDDCECASIADPNDLRDFGAKLNKYFYRAIDLRNSGITSVYSRSKFGVNFEKEQADLLSADGTNEGEI